MKLRKKMFKTLLLLILTPVLLITAISIYGQENSSEISKNDFKDKVVAVKSEAEAVKREAEINKKELELEKMKAEVKLQEAAAAKKEVEVIKESSVSKQEINAAIEQVRKKELEAQAAVEKVKIAESKMYAAQAAAGIVEEELHLAQERADIAEAKIRKQQNLFYQKLFQTGIVVFLGYLVIFISVAIINRRVIDVKAKYLIRKNVVYLLHFLTIIFVVFVWLQNLNSLTIFFSVVGAGMALALQEVVLCVAGWFLIMVRRQFDVGDRVELGGVKGDVIDIRVFQTSLLEIGNWVCADQSTGRIVNIPNSAMFKKEHYNYNRGFEYIWNEISILVTFETDWRRAKEIMLTHGRLIAEGMDALAARRIKNMTKQYMIYYEKLTPIVYVDIKDSGILLVLRYLTDARKRRSTQDTLSQAILDDFQKEDSINFAYPTY
ncbi:MAG: mechanosensitive ion channel [Candidatus Omnitrophica bacterium]|nr:mechanosensitive ion channel [Candidatus Omnitrophota bacterium]